MHLLIALVIIICLFVCETGTATPVDDTVKRLTAIGMITFAVPGLALFQTMFLTRYWQFARLPANSRNSMLKRMTTCHWAIWLAASLMILVSGKWHEIVRGNWQLGQLPVVDELLILLPILFSLVASWAVFYELQREVNLHEASLIADGHDIKTKPKNSGAGLSRLAIRLLDSARLQYVGIRVRVYLLMVLFPIGVFILLRDFTNPELVSTPVTCVVVGSTALAVIFGYPWLMCRIWNVRKVRDPELRDKFSTFCRDEKLNVRDVMIWDTGHQIVNAMVIGMVPGSRIILLSDALVQRFPEEELMAILRHEAGHIRLLHLPVRLMFVLLPLVVVASLEFAGWSLPAWITSSLSKNGWPELIANVAPAILYGLFLLASMSWLSRKMEFEADEFAAGGRGQICPTRAMHTQRALIRLANLDPARRNRGSLLHPGLSERVRKIGALTECENAG